MMAYWVSISSLKKNIINANTAVMAAIQYTEPAITFESFNSLILTF